MMHLLRKYDVAPLRSASDAMLAPMCRQAHIIRETNIIRRSRHHLPKASIIKKALAFASAFFGSPCWGMRFKTIEYRFKRNSLNQVGKVMSFD